MNTHPAEFEDSVLSVLMDNPTQVRAQSALWSLTKCRAPFEAVGYLRREWDAGRMSAASVAEQLWREMHKGAK